MTRLYQPSSQGGVNGIGILLGGVDDESLARIFGGNWMRIARAVWQPPF